MENFEDVAGFGKNSGLEWSTRLTMRPMSGEYAPFVAEHTFPTVRSAMQSARQDACMNGTVQVEVISPEGKCLNLYERSDNYWKTISVESRVIIDEYPYSHMDLSHKRHYLNTMIHPFPDYDALGNPAEVRSWYDTAYALHGCIVEFASHKDGIQFLKNPSESLAGLTPLDYISSPKYDRNILAKAVHEFLLEYAKTYEYVAPLPEDDYFDDED